MLPWTPNWRTVNKSDKTKYHFILQGSEKIPESLKNCSATFLQRAFPVNISMNTMTNLKLPSVNLYPYLFYVVKLAIDYKK